MSDFIRNRQVVKRILPLKNSKPEFTWFLDDMQLLDNCINNGAWEPNSTLACERWVKPGMFCLDIGANIGYFTVLLNHLAGADGEVIGFEPMQVTQVASGCDDQAFPQLGAAAFGTPGRHPAAGRSLPESICRQERQARQIHHAGGAGAGCVHVAE